MDKMIYTVSGKRCRYTFASNFASCYSDC